MLHLLLDGYGAERTALQDEALIFHFLDTCPLQIGMTKIQPPSIYNYRGDIEEDWGLSGFVLIAESHMSIHTYPDRLCLYVDLFSCKTFDVDAAVASIKQIFGLSYTRMRVVDRGPLPLQAV